LLKFIKSLPLRRHGHFERMSAKNTGTLTVDGTRKRGRPRKRWWDKVEADLTLRLLMSYIYIYIYIWSAYS